MCCAALAKELNNKYYSLIYVRIDAAARGRNVWQAECLLNGKSWLVKGQTPRIQDQPFPGAVVNRCIWFCILLWTGLHCKPVVLQISLPAG